MRTSSDHEVRDFYDASAGSYEKIMDAEIHLPIYGDALGRLAERIADVDGTLIDPSCGPGHMLSTYHESFDPERALLGVDLSPRMIELARARLGPSIDCVVGDMRHLESVEPCSAAAVLSFFAIHHVDLEDMPKTLTEWHRVLREGGQLVLAAWEGSGPIDYGDVSDVVALLYLEAEVVSLVESAGFGVDRCRVEPVDEIPMKAIYLEATKA